MANENGIGQLLADGVTGGAKNAGEAYSNMMKMTSDFFELSPELAQADYEEKKRQIGRIQERMQSGQSSPQDQKTLEWIQGKVQQYEQKMQRQESGAAIPQQEAGFDPMGMAKQLKGNVQGLVGQGKYQFGQMINGAKEMLPSAEDINRSYETNKGMAKGYGYEMMQGAGEVADEASMQGAEMYRDASDKVNQAYGEAKTRIIPEQQRKFQEWMKRFNK